MFLILFISCDKNKDHNFQLLDIKVDNYYFFNEVLFDRNTGFTINLKNKYLKINNGDVTKEYSLFYYNKEKEISIIKEDMVIKFYDLKMNKDTLFLKTKWLPKNYTMEWKEEYWGYKKNGIQLVLIKKSK